MSKVRSPETGAALITVLLLVALMSAVAVAMMDVTLASVRRAKVVDERSRFAWQMIGTEQIGLVGIDRLWRETNGELYDGVAGLGNEFVVPVTGAQIVGRIEEASNCFNLNALSVAGEANQQQIIADGNFRTLLSESGFPDSDVDRLTDALMDWMDSDQVQRPAGAEDGYYSNLRPSYLAADTRLAELSELRAIRGYGRTVFEQLQGLVCVREGRQMSTININTLKPEQSALLSMVFSGQLSRDIARDIILARPLGGWRSVEDMFANDRVQRITPDLRQSNLLSTRSEYLALESQIVGAEQETRFSVLYAIGENRPARIVARSIGGGS